MKGSTSLVVKCAGPRISKGLVEVLVPDNVAAPRGLRLAVRDNAGTLTFMVESPSLATALSTSVSLLNDIALFDRVWLLSRGMKAKSQRRHR